MTHPWPDLTGRPDGASARARMTRCCGWTLPRARIHRLTRNTAKQREHAEARRPARETNRTTGSASSAHERMTHGAPRRRPAPPCCLRARRAHADDPPMRRGPRGTAVEGSAVHRPGWRHAPIGHPGGRRRARGPGVPGPHFHGAADHPRHPSDELPGTGRHRKGSDPGNQSAGPPYEARLPRTRGSPRPADRTGKDSGVGSARGENPSARNRSESTARGVPRTREKPACAQRPAARTRDASANSRMTPRERVGSTAQPGGWPCTHGPGRRTSAATGEQPLGATTDDPPWARKG